MMVIINVADMSLGYVTFLLMIFSPRRLVYVQFYLFFRHVTSFIFAFDNM